MWVRDVQLIEDRMLKRLLVVGVVVAGCQGPEAFRGHLGGGVAGSPGSGATGGSSGAAGIGVVPMTGTAGDGMPAGANGAAGSNVLTGVAGTLGAGTAGTGTAGAGTAGAGAAGTSGATGTAGAAGSGAAGTNVVVDAGAGQGGGPRDAAPEAPASVAYASTNWKPTASITAAGNANLPPNAFDGKTTTRWTTGRNQMGDETFTVDLGQAMPVSRVVLDDTTDARDFPAAYTLEVSTNGMTFTGVQMGKGATVTDIQFARVNARYVRIRQTGMTPAGGSWWSIDELRIYS
jgi:hypothetical protein